MLRISFLFLIFTLSANAWDPNSMISCESEPSALVEGKVHAITGRCAIAEKDLVIQGTQPIPIRRIFAKGKWVFSPSIIPESISLIPGDCFILMENTGAEIQYTVTKDTIQIQNEPYSKSIPRGLNQGYTNTSKGSISSRTNLHNNVILVDRKAKQFILQCADGTTKTYKKVHHGCGRYDLISEQLPNRNWILYEYEVTSDIKPVEPRLRSIQTTNPDQTKMYARADFVYEGSEKNNFKIIGSDGQVVEYRYENQHLVNIQSSASPDEAITYHKFSPPLQNNSPVIKKISLPLHRSLNIDYYTDQTHIVKGRYTNLEHSSYDEYQCGDRCERFVPDPRCTRVLSLSAPVGSDTISYPTSTFLYDLKNRTTTVFDAEDRIIEYEWDYFFRLKEIRHFCLNKRLQKVDRFSWNEEGNLIEKQVLDGQNSLLWSKKYSYNPRGDILEERITGNLSGQGPPESYSRKFTYQEGTISLPICIREQDGKKIERTYLPQTDLITSESIYEKEELKERKLWEYNANNILVREICETKTSYLIRQITPKLEAPYFGMPSIIEEKYRENGHEYLKCKAALHYTTGAKIAQKDIYDSANRFQYSIKYKYDEKGRLIEQTDPLGRIEQFAYDLLGNRISHTHLSGRKTATFQYDYSNRLISTEQIGDDGITLREEFSYDKKHRLINESKPLGHVIHYKYDSFGHLAEKEFPNLKHTFSYAYDPFGRLIAEINPQGLFIKTSYNIYNKPTRIEHPDGSIEQNIYYLNGSLKTSINPEAVETNFTYNYQNHPISKTITYQGKVLTSETSLFDGPYLISKTDPEGNQINFTYNQAGQLISIDLAHEKTEFAYDSLGRQILEKKGSLSLIKKYDMANRVIEETKESQNTILQRVLYTYDSADNQTSITRFIDSQKAIERFHYDSLGRRTQSIDPLGHISQTLYEQNPLLKETFIDPLGLKTVKQYNAQQKVTSLEIFNNQNHSISTQESIYDWRGNLLEQKFQNSRINRYIYDSMGRLIQKVEAATQPYAKATHQSYDKIGRLVQVIKPNGTSLYYSYDPLNHLISLSSSDHTINYTYTYDRLGRQLTALDLNKNQRTEKQHDPHGRILQETLATGFTSTNTYDSLGRRIQHTLPDASSIQYDYDALYLRKISRYSKHTLLYSHTFGQYDQSGNLTQENLIANLGPITHKYNSCNQKDALLSPHFNHQIIQRDPAGNILQFNLNEETCTFTYDDLYQLSSEKDHHYTADSDYCRRQKDGEKYEVNDLLQTTSHLDYDQNGNAAAQNNTFLTYDALDRLIQVQTPQAQILYTYDSDHRRLSKTTHSQNNQSQTIFYLYDGQKEIGSIDTTDNIQELRILNPTTQSEIGSAIAIELKNQIFVPIHDLMGNIRLLLSTDGEVTASYQYTAFGEEIIPELTFWQSLWQSNTTPLNPWRFSSKRTDPETGLIYYGRRYYSPTLGCWLTPDPAESSPNLYAFVHNNPLLYIDLFGLFTSDRASDICFHDPSGPFSVGVLGDKTRGTVNFHSGINNPNEDVKLTTAALYDLLGKEYAIEGHSIHNHGMLHGLSLVASEKLSKSKFRMLFAGWAIAGKMMMQYSDLRDVIEYHKQVLGTTADLIIEKGNPMLKQVHILFSNASYPFREALLALTPEQRDTIIAISCGPTTLIENHLAHKVHNIIGEKDWASKICNGTFKCFIGDKDTNVRYISQSETKSGIGGHFFLQPEYQKTTSDTFRSEKETYAIY